MRLCDLESHAHTEGSTREKGGRSYELHAAGSGQRCCSSIQALCLITAQRCPVWPALLPARANSRIATRQDTAAYATVPLRTAGLIEESCPHAQQHITRCEGLHHHRQEAQEQSSH